MSKFVYALSLENESLNDIPEQFRTKDFRLHIYGYSENNSRNQTEWIPITCDYTHMLTWCRTHYFIPVLTVIELKETK